MMMLDFMQWCKKNTEERISDSCHENSATGGVDATPVNVPSLQVITHTGDVHKPVTSNGFFSGATSLWDFVVGSGKAIETPSESHNVMTCYESYQQSIKNRGEYEQRKKGLSSVQCEVYYNSFKYMKILGFPKDKNMVSKKEIEDQYRSMSIKYHPDKKGGTNDSFQRLSDAKEFLLSMVVESVMDDNGVSISRLEELIAREGSAIKLYEEGEKFKEDCSGMRSDIGGLKRSTKQKADKIKDLNLKIDNLLAVMKEYGINVDEEAVRSAGPSYGHDTSLGIFASESDVSDSGSDSTEPDSNWHDAQDNNDTSSQDGNPY